MSAASPFAGLATTQGELIAAHDPGLGAAVITPPAVSIILHGFEEPPERDRGLGICGALAGLGAATGVLLGGVITSGPRMAVELLHQRAVAVVVALSLRMLPESRAPSSAFDVAGGAAITLGIVVSHADAFGAGIGSWRWRSQWSRSRFVNTTSGRGAAQRRTGCGCCITTRPSRRLSKSQPEEAILALEEHEFWSMAHNPEISAIELVSQRLKALVESGTRLGIAADRPATPIDQASKRSKR